MLVDVDITANTLDDMNPLQRLIQPATIDELSPQDRRHVAALVTSLRAKGTAG